MHAFVDVCTHAYMHARILHASAHGTYAGPCMYTCTHLHTQYTHWTMYSHIDPRLHPGECWHTDSDAHVYTSMYTVTHAYTYLFTLTHAKAITRTHVHASYTHMNAQDNSCACTQTHAHAQTDIQ